MKTEKPIHIVYFSDPVCSYCWGSEPIISRLKRERGDKFYIEYRMGGLMPDWSMFTGHPDGPAVVGKHWPEAQRELVSGLMEVYGRLTRPHHHILPLLPLKRHRFRERLKGWNSTL